MYVPTMYLLVAIESQAQFETRIKYWVYVRRITRCTMIEKAAFFSQNWCKENSFCSMWVVACGFSSIKIHFPDPPKSSISRIIENYVFFN